MAVNCNSSGSGRPKSVSCFVRATEEIDLLVPDDKENNHLVLDALKRLGGVPS